MFGRLIQFLLIVFILLASGPLSANDGIDTTAEAATNQQGKARQPNIIVFLVDDLGWQDSSVSFHSEPSLFQQHFRTPHLKRLADRGVRFDNAYAHCVCSPTRTSIMLGQNPVRHHVTNWTLYPNKDQSGKTSRIRAPENWKKEGIQPGITLAGLLQRAGYHTIHCGKAHWGAIGTKGSDPTNLGFHVNIAGHSAGAPGSYQGQNNFGNNEDGTQKLPWGVPGLQKYHGTNTHLTDALTKEVCQAIDATKKSDPEKPFFLYMAPYAVHTPIQPHPRFVANYLGKKYPGTDIEIPIAEAHYASMVEGYDAALGQIMNQLTAMNIADQTLILFTSDNGGLTVHARGKSPYGTGKNTHNRPLREGKGSAYEGGTRVPMVVSWLTPDSGSELQKRIPIARNTVCHQTVVSEDIFATVCHWADAKLPNPDEHFIDGIDFTKNLTASDQPKSADIVPRPLLFHYPHVWGPKGDGYQPHSALRFGKWKVIYFYHEQRWELYDLEADLGEATDLANSNPDRLKTMQDMLRSKLEELGAQYPTEIESGNQDKPK